MASGILGRVMLTASTVATAYTVPAGKTASVTVALCNQSASDPSKIRIALSDSDTPSSNTYIEYDSNIPASGVLERSAIVLAAGQKIVVRATTSYVSAVVFGIEE